MNLPLLPDGRVRCCGRIAMVYKRDRYFFCLKCDHRYAFDGDDMGIHGSGIATKEEYMAWLRGLRR